MGDTVDTVTVSPHAPNISFADVVLGKTFASVGGLTVVRLAPYGRSVHYGQGALRLLPCCEGHIVLFGFFTFIAASR